MEIFPIWARKIVKNFEQGCWLVSLQKIKIGDKIFWNSAMQMWMFCSTQPNWSKMIGWFYCSVVMPPWDWIIDKLYVPPWWPEARWLSILEKSAIDFGRMKLISGLLYSSLILFPVSKSQHLALWTVDCFGPGIIQLL